MHTNLQNFWGLKFALFGLPSRPATGVIRIEKDDRKEGYTSNNIMDASAERVFNPNEWKPGESVNSRNLQNRTPSYIKLQN